MLSEDCTEEAMTREEAKRVLRRLELDAYSAVVTAFRAQGDVDRSKKCVLSDLANHLSISTERHRAEVRRVVNDERLNAVAACMHGSGTSTEWSIEGRRLVSLMPRLVPQTVFTAKATAAANQAVKSNEKLPIKTEIEVLPLPNKLKSISSKTNSCDRDSTPKPTLKDFTNVLFDDKLKKTKKSNLVASKASMQSKVNLLNSSLPLIKTSPLKAQCSASVGEVASVTTPSSKAIFLQRSPTKNLHKESMSRSQGVNLQSFASSFPLTSINTTSKQDFNSFSTGQPPTIKVLSNSQANLNATTSDLAVNSTNLSTITQKIKFKTPLPKPKVKTAKFKPMVQRPLSASSVNDTSFLVGSTSPQNMSVKVVQMTKPPSCALSMVTTTNRPVVSVSKNPIQSMIAFNNIANSISQQMKAASATQLPTSVMSTLPKGVLNSKSMPLTTGFKMIAVTTVVQGTTQVKTVYIATPIMSLSKTVSHGMASTITSPASNSLKRTPLTSNFQSVTTSSLNAFTKNPCPRSVVLSVPSFSKSKATRVMPTPKGLGSLTTTLAGQAQSLKLFTAVSKKNPLTSSVNITKNIPLMPTTHLPYSVMSQQTLQKLNVISNQNAELTIKPNNIESHLSEKRNPNDSPPPKEKIFLSTSSEIITEQITVSATAETDELAFLNAGEKFLEQLSVKMNAPSLNSLLVENQLPSGKLEKEVSDTSQECLQNNGCVSTCNNNSLVNNISDSFYESNGKLLSQVHNNGFHALTLKSSPEKSLMATSTSKLSISPVNNNLLHNSSSSVVNFKMNSTSSSTESCSASSETRSTPSSVNNFYTQNTKSPPITKKRKMTAITADVPSPRTQASWVRGAANLLQRVSRFRGSSKQKGEMNAASWFTRSVDPNEAPDYYNIIKTPMDFGKIKRKLEEGQYSNYMSFYDDMTLVKKNCYMYNPVNHVARKDCDDVFSFFDVEYQKLLERWEKHHVSPHKKIKLSADENG